jgi:hypothetical protein
MPTITFRVTDELASAIDEARGELTLSDWLRGLVEARLSAPVLVVERPVVVEPPREVIEVQPVVKPVAQMVPAAKAGRSPTPSASNVQRYREKIEPLITGSWKTPREIAAVTGIHERIVEKMLQDMDVEWQRGAVRLR